MPEAKLPKLRSNSTTTEIADLEREYLNMYETYTRIFKRLGLAFRAVAADTGAIGGTGSHEFQAAGSWPL